MNNTLSTTIAQFRKELLPFVFGKNHLIDVLLVTLIMRGHILIEDLPGVGKTTVAKAFSALLGREFSRIQGTSDTLVQDVIGGEILDMQTKKLHLRKGPIFAEIVLVDEINRMHPKTQSAFLEAMEERQVSLAGKVEKLPHIHMILATQNPIEYSGTYPLPEAHRDRFACRLSIGFPDRALQKHMLIHQQYRTIDAQIAGLPSVLSAADLKTLEDYLPHVTISDIILDRLLDFVDWTRTDTQFRYGVSPRGVFQMTTALRAYAMLIGRDMVVPADVRVLLPYFLLHRIELVNGQGRDVLEQVCDEKLKEVFRGI
jgi:MoxR-like ATPase